MTENIRQMPNMSSLPFVTKEFSIIFLTYY